MPRDGGSFNRVAELRMALSICSRCRIVDRPFIKYEVYERWLPDHVNVMLIAESPPPGFKDSFFYNLGGGDRLRSNLRLILGLSLSDGELLKWLKGSKVFITSAIKCRPPRGAKQYRDETILKEMARRCSSLLKMEVEALRPAHVVALGRVAALSASYAGVKIESAFPHPNYLVRFNRGLMPRVKEVLSRLMG